MAKTSLIYFLKSLPINSYFNIVSFGSNYELLFPLSIRLDENNINYALEIIDHFDANLGGTEIKPPLKWILK